MLNLERLPANRVPRNAQRYFRTESAELPESNGEICSRSWKIPRAESQRVSHKMVVETGYAGDVTTLVELAMSHPLGLLQKSRVGGACLRACMIINIDI